MKRPSLCLCVIALAVASLADAATAAGGPAVSALVQTAAVTERSVAESMPVYGTVVPEPREILTLAAPRESIIAGVAVNSGERVHKGQVLVTLLPTPASRTVFVQAKSAQHDAATVLAHTRALYKEHLATRDQVTAAEKALTDAEAALAAAEQAGGGGALRLRAPGDAVVTGVTVTSGERVAANTTLLVLAIRGGQQVRLGVAPEQAGAVHIGLPVRLASVFDAQVTARGKITGVGGMLDPGTGLVDVFVPLPRAAQGFLPGAAVHGVIILQDNRSLAVPRSAVLRDGQGAYVFIVRNHTAHRVNVKAGADDGTWIAVSGDLKAGDQVVTLGNYELTDGMAVRETAR
ncbi:MAG: efflux RND transporter periplasmic adaptor subunit [Gammaproteobacteria bacterium]|nr:efflux RND transporter periplasmic adaptor subunit [Gammaproteobacteria bacterium]MDE2024673.1 efflux RND transporter periplasmic adaptor subunit [Gammaproteobacteria bacterium]MDE2273982.1 efflux RND transporter periplasmic adaptor subunit [Gammaproteobacteria bacterium]